MDLHEIASSRSDPGILIFNQNRDPVFANSAALLILSKFNESSPGPALFPIGASIPKEIYQLFDGFKKKGSGGGDSPRLFLFSQQEETYSCRGMWLDSGPNGSNGSSKKSSHVMMLIEKVQQSRQVDFEAVKKTFQLTSRQVDIIKLLFMGSSNKQIADRLFISEDTIKGHLKHIMRQLQVNSRTQILSIILKL